MSTTLNKYKKNIGRGINLWINGPVLIVGVVWQKEIFARKCWHYRCKGPRVVIRFLAMHIGILSPKKSWPK